MGEDHVSASYQDISVSGSTTPQNYIIKKFQEGTATYMGAHQELKVGQESLVPTINSLIAKFDQYSIQETILLQSYDDTPELFTGIEVTRCLIANLPDVRQQLAEAVTKLNKTRLSTLQNTDIHEIYDLCSSLDFIIQEHINVINVLLSPHDGQLVIEEYPEGVEKYVQSLADKLCSKING